MENISIARANGKIKVLIVDDSNIAIVILRRILAREPGIEVVGTAANGMEALKLIPVLDPAVVCTDLHMPVMGGLELTREIMRRFPRPILVISASVSEGSENVFQLLQEGALDVFQKPRSREEEDYAAIARELAGKIRVLAGVHVFRRMPKSIGGTAVFQEGAPRAGGRIVAIGASTGGPQALQMIFSALPADYPYPVVCIQHISEGFLDGLIEWLGSLCRLRVAVARDGELPLRGTVYFPPEGHHLLLDGNGVFRYSTEAPGADHCPSISATFQSLARVMGASVVGVLLTGMGSDGADGMKAIAERGGATIAQDEKSCVVFGMPKKAIEARAAQRVLSIEQIAAVIAGGVF